MGVSSCGAVVLKQKISHIRKEAEREIISQKKTRNDNGLQEILSTFLLSGKTFGGTHASHY